MPLSKFIKSLLTIYLFTFLLIKFFLSRNLIFLSQMICLSFIICLIKLNIVWFNAVGCSPIELNCAFLEILFFEYQRSFWGGIIFPFTVSLFEYFRNRSTVIRLSLCFLAELLLCGRLRDLKLLQLREHFSYAN
jgi:hypothetical protein